MIGKVKPQNKRKYSVFYQKKLLFFETGNENKKPNFAAKLQSAEINY